MSEESRNRGKSVFWGRYPAMGRIRAHRRGGGTGRASARGEEEELPLQWWWWPGEPPLPPLPGGPNILEKTMFAFESRLWPIRRSRNRRSRCTSLRTIVRSGRLRYPFQGASGLEPVNLGLRH